MKIVNQSDGIYKIDNETKVMYDNLAITSYDDNTNDYVYNNDEEQNASTAIWRPS